MKVTVRKWGDGVSVRIPGSVMRAAKLELDQVVDVREEGGRVIVEPVLPDEYDLTGLLSGISPGNLHGEIDVGEPVGRECGFSSRGA